MRPTPRGWLVVALLVVALLAAHQHGPRALEALVVTAGGALLAAVASVYRVGEPTVRRGPVPAGFVTDRRDVAVTVETAAPVSATLRDGVGDGLDANDPEAETTIDGAEELRYRIRLAERGEHRLGPLTIVVTDVLGLLERRFRSDETTAVLAFPRCYDLGEAGGHLARVVDAARGAGRGEFDHLREYERGDPLRDVHWKAAAKRVDDGLLVAERADVDAPASITVVAECEPGADSSMATAAASVVAFLLEREIPVGLRLPDGSRRPASDDGHYRELLRLLAVTDGGRVEDRDRRRADVRVDADADGATIAVDGTEVPFETLRRSRRRPFDAGDGRVGGSRSGREVVP